jgi:hypothetical protein
MRSDRSWVLASIAAACTMFGSCKDLIEPTDPNSTIGPSHSSIGFIHEVDGVEKLYFAIADVVIFDDAHPLEDGGLVSAPIDGISRAADFENIQPGNYGIALIHTDSRISSQMLPNLEFDAIDLPGTRFLRHALPSLSGRVILPAEFDPAGLATVDLDVRWSALDPRDSRAYGMLTHVQAAADGEFSISMPPGPYDFFATANNENGKLDHDFEELLEMDAATTLELTLPHHATRFQFAAHPLMSGEDRIEVDCIKLSGAYGRRWVWRGEYELGSSPISCWSDGGVHEIEVSSPDDKFFGYSKWLDLSMETQFMLELGPRRVEIQLLDSGLNPLRDQTLSVHAHDQRIHPESDSLGVVELFLEDGSYLFELPDGSSHAADVSGDSSFEWSLGGGG